MGSTIGIVSDGLPRRRPCRFDEAVYTAKEKDAPHDFPASTEWDSSAGDGDLDVPPPGGLPAGSIELLLGLNQDDAPPAVFDQVLRARRPARPPEPTKGIDTGHYDDGHSFGWMQRNVSVGAKEISMRLVAGAAAVVADLSFPLNASPRRWTVQLASVDAATPSNRSFATFSYADKSGSPGC